MDGCECPAARLVGAGCRSSAALALKAPKAEEAQLAAHLRAEGHAPSADALRRAVEAVADEEDGLAIQGDAVVLI